MNTYGFSLLSLRLFCLSSVVFEGFFRLQLVISAASAFQLTGSISVLSKDIFLVRDPLLPRIPEDLAKFHLR